MEGNLEQMLRDVGVFAVAKEIHKAELSKEILKEKIEIKYVNVPQADDLRTKEDVYAPLMEDLATATTFGDLVEKRTSALESLHHLDIFKTVNITVIPAVRPSTLRDRSEPLPVIINVDLEEKKRVGLSAKTHTTTELQPYALVRGELRNVFGRGEKLAGHFKRTYDNSTEFEGSFSKPLLRWGYDKSFSLAAHKQNNNYEHLSGFNEDNIGFSTGVGMGRHGVSYEGAYRDVRVTKGASLAILREGGESVKSAVKYRWNYDTRDDNLLPLEGSQIQLTTEVAGLGGDARHVSPEVRVQKHMQIHPSGWGLHFISRFGMHVPYGGARSYISDRYFLGGPLSFRGFSERGVGPRRGKDAHGGDLVYTSALHLSYPLLQFSWGVLRSHIFAQTGNLKLYDESQTMTNNVNNLFGGRRASVGVGFFLSTNLGLGAQWTYTHPIAAFNTDDTKNFQFGLYVDFM